MATKFIIAPTIKPKIPRKLEIKLTTTRITVNNKIFFVLLSMPGLKTAIKSHKIPNVIKAEIKIPIILINFYTIKG